MRIASPKSNVKLAVKNNIVVSLAMKILTNLLLVLFCFGLIPLRAQKEKETATPPDPLFPIRGFAISAPPPQGVERFIKFIHDELAPRKINTLILRVDFNYQYDTYPTLRDSLALSKSDVRRLADECMRNNIRIIPQINLLGHQSWAGKIGNLLNKFPEFDETPHIKMPAKYEWPNADGLYCKSYCPLHPEVHKVVFALVDELLDVFQTDAFHAGMDEVFYLGDDKCPRCSGRDKAELFANEVRTVRDHLALKNRELWIWGDRLIDGKTTGIGMWEASFNNTHRAVDMIPRDIVICDWHYERPDPTAAYFAIKGLRVVTCPWRNPPVAVLQAENMARLRKTSTKQMKERFYGLVQTVWSGTDSFLDGFYGIEKPANPSDITNTPWVCFKTLFTKMDELSKGN